MKDRSPDSEEQYGSPRPTPPLGPANEARAPNGSRMNRIAERAHEIYERRGGENGKALDDWLQAEREIDGED